MTEEKIEIMQAYVDGRDIEFRSKKNIRGEWSEIPSGRNPHWNWEVFDYRLKPKHQPSKHQPSKHTYEFNNHRWEQTTWI